MFGRLSDGRRIATRRDLFLPVCGLGAVVLDGL
jgi:hypothetical protein